MANRESAEIVDRFSPGFGTFFPAFGTPRLDLEPASFGRKSQQQARGPGPPVTSSTWQASKAPRAWPSPSIEILGTCLCASLPGRELQL